MPGRLLESQYRSQLIPPAYLPEAESTLQERADRSLAQIYRLAGFIFAAAMAALRFPQPVEITTYTVLVVAIVFQLILTALLWKLCNDFDQHYGQSPKYWRTRFVLISLIGLSLWTAYTVYLLLGWGLTFYPLVAVAGTYTLAIAIPTTIPHCPTYTTTWIFLTLAPISMAILYLGGSAKAILLANLIVFLWAGAVYRTISSNVWQGLVNTYLLEFKTHELRQALKKADKASKAKSEFLANTSHEIRTPMNSIMGLVELLQRSGLQEQERNWLDTINKSSQGLLHLIDDLLDLSKIEAGELAMETEQVNLKQVLTELTELMKPRAEAKGIALKYSLAPTLHGGFWSDPYRIKQILLNLVGNALKFTEKGEISIRIEPTSRQVQSERRWVRFSVSDTGKGISKELKNKLFEPFVQGQGGRGTGLGLAITARLAALLGGTIEASNRSDGGSVFKVEIPLYLTESSSSKDLGPILRKIRQNQRNWSQDRKPSILVVDDDGVNRMVAEAQLNALGVENFVVESGRLAVEAATERYFDLILMDIQMPGLDGFETTQQIRDLDLRNPELPIVALTAHAMRGERDRCLAAGMDDYLTKPLRLKTLENTLRLWLDWNPPSPPILREKRTSGLSGQIPPLDPERIEILLDLGERSGRNVLTEVSRIFLDQAPNQKSQIREALKRKSFPQIAQIAHTWRGSAGNIGAIRLQYLLKQLEAAANDAHLEAAQAQFNLTEQELVRVESALRELGN